MADSVKIVLSIQEGQGFPLETTSAYVSVQAVLAGKSISTEPVLGASQSPRFQQDLIWDMPNAEYRKLKNHRTILRIQVVSQYPTMNSDKLVVGFALVDIQALPLNMGWRTLSGIRKPMKPVQLRFQIRVTESPDERVDQQRPSVSKSAFLKSASPVRAKKPPIYIDKEPNIKESNNALSVKSFIGVKLMISCARFTASDSTSNYSFRFLFMGHPVTTEKSPLSHTIDYEVVFRLPTSKKTETLNSLGDQKVILCLFREDMTIAWIQVNVGLNGEWQEYALQIDGMGEQRILVQWLVGDAVMPKTSTVTEINTPIDALDDEDTTVWKHRQMLEFEKSLADLERQSLHFVGRSWKETLTRVKQQYDNAFMKTESLDLRLKEIQEELESRLNDMKRITDAGEQSLALTKASLLTRIRDSDLAVERLRAELEHKYQLAVNKRKDSERRIEHLERESLTMQKKAEQLKRTLDKESEELAREGSNVIQARVAELRSEIEHLSSTKQRETQDMMNEQKLFQQTVKQIDKQKRKSDPHWHQSAKERDKAQQRRWLMDEGSLLKRDREMLNSLRQELRALMQQQ